MAAFSGGFSEYVSEPCRRVKDRDINRIDCISTEELRDWLVSIRPEGPWPSLTEDAVEKEIVLLGWLLVAGKAILLPVFIAAISVFLLVSATEALRRLPILGRLPGELSAGSDIARLGQLKSFAKPEKTGSLARRSV